MEELPQELVWVIARYLPWREVVRLASTCKTLRRTLEERPLYEVARCDRDGFGNVAQLDMSSTRFLHPR